MRVLDHDTGNLLRALVQPPSAARKKALAESVSKIGCWQATLEGARQHGVLPMLFSELLSIAEPVPPDTLDEFRNEFERNAFQCYANASELIEVLRVFESAEIPAMPFKGVVLGASVYGDMTTRIAGDLDVLIRFRDLLPATRILKERGYELTTLVLEDGSPEAENYFEYHFERPDDGMVLELRWRLELSPPHYNRDLGMNWVWPRRRMARLAGADVPNLDAVTCLLMLCMHGSKHVWTRLIWICDVAKLLQSEPELDWNSAIREAKRLGLWRCLALGVLLAHGVAGAPVSADALRSFEADRRARRLASFFQVHALTEPGSLPDGRVPYYLQLLGFRERVGVFTSPKLFRPSARDRAVLKLPKALEPLYFLIRPFRLLIDRSGR
jgi:hypothetical protein